MLRPPPRAVVHRARAVSDVADATCTFEGCGRPLRSQGLCEPHYRQLIRRGYLSPIQPRKTRAPALVGCSIGGCDTTGPITRGWCPKHYSRWRTHGDPLMLAWGTAEDRFWSNVAIAGADDCWLWTSPWVNEGGYGLLGIDGKSVLAHRFSWELHNGPIPDGLCVLHRCDNPACCNPAHLFLGTRPDNSADMVTKGRSSRGSRSPAAKLTEEDVRVIRRRVAGCEAQRTVAADFGVRPQTISKIVRRQRWRHVSS